MNNGNLFFVVWVLFFSNFAVANPSHLDKKTIINAAKTVINYEVLLQVSNRCENNDYLDLIGAGELESTIKTRVKKSLSDFKTQLSEEYLELDRHFVGIEKLPCSEELLEELYDRFDLAFFALSISEPIETELLTQGEIWQRNTDSGKVKDVNVTNKLNELYQQSYAVVVGTLLYTNDVPKKYKKQFINSLSRNKFSYHMEKGWKATFPRYIVGKESSHEWKDRFSDESDERTGIKSKKVRDEIGTQYLFFINDEFNVIDRLPVKGNEKLIELFGEVRWYWLGGDLFYNKSTN